MYNSNVGAKRNKWEICKFSITENELLSFRMCHTRTETDTHSPEVLGAQHLSVVHDLALVRGHLQGGQHVVHSGQVGGRAGWHVVEPPLENVETRPPGDVGALRMGGTSKSDSKQKRHHLLTFLVSLPAHSRPPCR